MKPLRINKGTIRCKLCNRPKLHATMPCPCEKENTWGTPFKTRETKEARAKKNARRIKE